MKRFLSLSLLVLSLAGCDKPTESTTQINSAANQCFKNTDCKGERICESGQCVNPGAAQNIQSKPELTASTPAAPTVSYEALIISGDDVGPFSMASTDMGQAIHYQSRAGVMNLLEYVLEDIEATGYVAFEKVYAFGPNKYVLVISTGERGRSCEATTYAFSFDAKSQSVDGKTEIDGCSELVETFADGNKLSIKKDGETTVVYNGEVK